MNSSKTDRGAALGARIKLQRTKLAWTQELLAERAGLSVRTVQRVEGGEEPSAETLRALATAMGVTVTALRPEDVRRDFGAPAAKTVKVVTVVVLVLLILGMVFSGFLGGWLTFVLMGTIALAAAFSVSGYSVRDEEIVVHRLGWATRFPLADLTEVSVNPHAMMGSIRLWGNGGFFGYIGSFRNEVLGRYRALLTNPANGVVLRFGEGRPVLVSPDAPEVFRESVEAALARRAQGDMPTKAEAPR
ncbi:helix-turn-helix domain-containing protein [Actomonas aquatica]|uniref:Helix-turn-helix domain-containing protein n=1 Tax=Actomonas aquatica TaxID=2866162 RepID=A0ABZ1C2F6_9BACT|nr:helix-turn-helix domain-containing protein [Opitutus sp. WL0086]WRQ85888.1 helix-turn-helix domain-containing protein [Opitutus sp. WL0086]